MKHFVIFDVSRPILEENQILTAKTPIDAVKNYLKAAGIAKKPKRSGSNYVQISAKEIVIKDGQKYYAGKPTQWYELTTTN